MTTAVQARKSPRKPWTPSQIILTLLVEATGIAGNRLPEILPSLYEVLLPF